MKKLIFYGVLVAVIIFAFYFAIDFIGIGKDSETKNVVIPNGSSVFEIADILKKNELINSKFMFAGYSLITGAKYHSGQHEITGRGYSNISNELKKTTSAKFVRLTIKEGSEFDEIAQTIENEGLATKNDFYNAAKANKYDYWFLKEIPKRDNELEGYLFPDTYEFSMTEGAESIINKMLDNFNKKITKDRIDKIKEKKLTLDKIIIMASIVEREAAVKEEFPLVAGVFYNRINGVGESNGLLESCATVQYILKERKSVLSVEDTKIKSPYNTYLNKGLPIGPIASPGLMAIDAAINPTDTDYLYFVSDGSKKHYFAKTYAEHLENVRKAGL